MAKKRSAPKRRRPSKVVNFNRAVSRKRSVKNSDRLQKAAYIQEAPEADSVPQTPSAPKDLSGWGTEMANQVAAEALVNYTRALSFPLQSAVGQVGFPSQMPMAQFPSLMRNAAQAITRELINRVTQQRDRNFQAMNALTRIRSPQDFFRAQSDLAQDTLDSLLEATGRIYSIAIQMTIEASQINQFRLVR